MNLAYFWGKSIPQKAYRSRKAWRWESLRLIGGRTRRLRDWSRASE